MTVDTVAPSDLVGRAHEWMRENWSPDLTVGEWWERLGLAGWAAPMLPVEWYGCGASSEDAALIARTVGACGALRAPVGVGLGFAGPVIAYHGSLEQKERYLRDIVTGRAGWCQLFSEPGAGSDLAGLTTRAVKDGDEWVVNGQKVWTSNAMYADFAILLARSDPDVPKHQGITYFVLHMDQPGVEVRPLREMNGRSEFNEVFLTDARVHHDDIVGGVDNGWAMARATLAYERAMIGTGGSGVGFPGAEPGAKTGALGQRCSEFTAPGAVMPKARGSFVDFGFLLELARALGKDADPLVRQDLARLYILDEIARVTTLRGRALREVGQEIPGLGNLAKLSRTRYVKLTRDAGMRIAGPAGTLHAYDDPAGQTVLDDATGIPVLAKLTDAVLFAQGSSIYGGTDEIQRNVVGEQVLGLPREPSNDRSVPFRDLAR